MNLSVLQTTSVSLVFLVGIIVLIALHDLSTAAGLPVLVAIAGVHVGSAITNTTSTVTSTAASTSSRPPIQ